MLLQRSEFFKINEKMQKIDPSINNIFREIERFITKINSIQNNQDTIQNIEDVKHAEILVKSVINLLFIKMNPGINPLISVDNTQSRGYTILSDRMEKLIKEIDKKKSELIKGLSNKESIDSNKVTNKANIDFFVSFLTGIIKDLIFNSLNEAKENYHALRNPGIKFTREAFEKLGKIDKEALNLDPIIKLSDETKLVVKPLEKNQEVFWYLVYMHLSRAIQITVSLFEYLPREISFKSFDVSDMDKFRIQSTPASVPEKREEHPQQKSTSSHESEEPEEEDDE